VNVGYDAMSDGEQSVDREGGGMDGWGNRGESR
jgi:hypothetical protein